MSRWVSVRGPRTNGTALIALRRDRPATIGVDDRQLFVSAERARPKGDCIHGWKCKGSPRVSDSTVPVLSRRTGTSGVGFNDTAGRAHLDAAGLSQFAPRSPARRVGVPSGCRGWRRPNQPAPCRSARQRRRTSPLLRFLVDGAITAGQRGNDSAHVDSAIPLAAALPLCVARFRHPPARHDSRKVVSSHYRPRECRSSRQPDLAT